MLASALSPLSYSAFEIPDLAASDLEIYPSIQPSCSSVKYSPSFDASKFADFVATLNTDLEKSYQHKRLYFPITFIIYE